MGLNFDEFKSVVLHDNYAMATWEPSQYLLKGRGKLREPVSK
jgi:hypothetical protein